MILPDNKNKKYVSFVCGLIVTIIMLNPIINLLNIDIDISKLLSENKVALANSEYSSMLKARQDAVITDTYKEKLKLDIVERLEEEGYKVSNIELYIDGETYEPTKIEMNIESYDGEINPIVIDVSNKSSDKVSEMDKQKIKNKLNSIYLIDKENINIR